MARQINRLTATKVNAIDQPGYYADGRGLYLQVSKALTKSWVFRFSRNGRTREMGFGSLHDVSLRDARDQLDECRRMLRDGLDPIDERIRKKAETREGQAALTSFKECAEAFIRVKGPEWSNPKHAKQWSSTLHTYVYSVFGNTPVSMIETHHVMKALEPIWESKTETATRVRQRIEAVLDAAKVQGFRVGENPARWKGHLDKLLPKPSKFQKIRHHKALPYPEIGDFMQQLRKRDNIAARGLEFLILSAARTGEVLGTKFDEIDTDNAVWTVPAERMKAGKEHRVPLPPRAIEIIKDMSDKRQNEFVFPGHRGAGLSNMALLQQLKRMGRNDLTAHGFRSTFRDWAAEQTAYPSDVVEMALAHTISNQTEAAYRRGDLFEKRARLMNEWASYCAQPARSGTVVKLR